MAEKRAGPRKLLKAEGEIGDALGSAWVPVQILDLSSGGVGFFCKQELIAGSIHMLRVHLPGNHAETLRVVVRVAYCHLHSMFDGYRIGGAFGELPDEAQALIDKFMG